MEVHEFSTTDASNTGTPPDGFPELMDYDDVNDAARALMGALARYWTDQTGKIVSGGTAPVYSITANQTFSALPDGYTVAFACHSGNLGAASTLNVNSSGNKDLVLPDGTDPVLAQGGIYLARYDASNDLWQLISASKPGQQLLAGTVTVNSSRNLVTSDVGKVLRVTADVTLTIPAGFGINAGETIRISNPDGRTIIFANSATGGSQNRLYLSFLQGSFIASGSAASGASFNFFTLHYLSATTGNYMLTDS